MTKLIVVLSLVLLGAPQASAQGYKQSQETRDAIQDQRLSQAEYQSSVNTSNILSLSNQFAAMKSSFDEFTGMCKGVGIVIGALQLVNLIVQLRGSKDKENGNGKYRSQTNGSN